MLSKKSLTNKRVKTIIEVCVKKRIKKDKDDPVGGKPGEKGLSMKISETSLSVNLAGMPFQI